jgi:hypothetical protein
VPFGGALLQVSSEGVVEEDEQYLFDEWGILGKTCA